jgi:hypothetical protein
MPVLRTIASAAAAVGTHQFVGSTFGLFLVPAGHRRMQAVINHLV